MRVDSTDEDDLIGDLITNARMLAEEYTRRRFITTGITLTLDRIPGRARQPWWDGVREGSITELLANADRIVLPFAPAIAVQSFKSYNDANTEAVFSSSAYRLEASGNLYLNDGYVWPTDLRNHAAVVIAYTAGYGASAASVPMPIRHAIKVAVAAMYEDRTCFSLPVAARELLNAYRVLEERSNGV